MRGAFCFRHPVLEDLPPPRAAMHSVAELWYSPSSMPESKPDRRTQKRLSLALPVTIKSEQGTIEASGCTRDLSSSGIFLYSDAHFSEGSALEMILILPKEMTGGEKRWVCCRASVVRVEASGEQRCGVAARILNMEALPEISG
jgi:c-di-GMP-binding flagellar brake protein YcgR